MESFLHLVFVMQSIFLFCFCANFVVYDFGQTSVSANHRQIICWSLPVCHSTCWVWETRNESVCPEMMTLRQERVSVYVRLQHNMLKAITKVNTDALGSRGRRNPEEIKWKVGMKSGEVSRKKGLKRQLWMTNRSKPEEWGERRMLQRGCCAQEKEGDSILEGRCLGVGVLWFCFSFP